MKRRLRCGLHRCSASIARSRFCAAAETEQSITILSYDKKPGSQAIGTKGPDLPTVAGRHESFGRDHEYVRHGILGLLAGIDLLAEMSTPVSRCDIAAESSSAFSSASTPPTQPTRRSS